VSRGNSEPDLSAVEEEAEAAEPAARGGVNSVEVAGALLRVLADAPSPARLADLARATGMPSAKAHRYMVSLIRAGLVEQDPASSRYDLGPLALRAGVTALSRSDALKHAERALEDIVERTGETAAAAVWGTHGPTLVRLVEARHELASRVPLGHVCALTFSAAGLVYCAFGDPDRTAPLAEREMAQSRATGRPGVPASGAELERLVTAVRELGFATIAIEGDGGLAAVSAPVFDAGGTRLQFALTVFGRPGRLDVTPDGPVAALMAEAARSLGAELHGHPTAGSRR
jgi:DNA-binding IclR family transcriptional regulator